MTSLVFAEVRSGMRDVVRLALEAARLPSSDIDVPDRLFFSLADDAGLIGFVGLEGAGPDRLLRSLVVLPTRRGHGFGKVLVERLESAAAGAVDRLHLLTNSAAPLFRHLGYQDAPRSAAPAAIAATDQFTSLCPASAAYLVKEITA